MRDTTGPQDPRDGGQGPVEGTGYQARRAQDQAAESENFDDPELDGPEGEAMHIVKSEEEAGVAFDDNEGLDGAGEEEEPV